MKDFVFKKYKDYELVLTVDFAESGNPNPFVIYIHGGGWARGDNSSSKTLSHWDKNTITVWKRDRKPSLFWRWHTTIRMRRLPLTVLKTTR